MNHRTIRTLFSVVFLFLLSRCEVFAFQNGEEYRSLGILSSRMVVWFVAQLHLLFAAFVLGVPIFSVIIEYIGVYKRDTRYDRLAREFITLTITAYSVTALLGGLLLFVLIAFYPGFFNYLSSVFYSTMIFYGLLFLAETVTLYFYYYSWESLGENKVIHLSLGVLLNLIGLTLMFVANSWATFMMSPSGIDMETGALTGLWEAVNNPTWMPVNIHRLIGNIAFGGAVVAAYGAIRFLLSETKEEKAHYDWMGHTGNLIAISALIPLPFAGYWLGKEIYDYNQAMGIRMMGDLFSWLFIIQASMVGVIFLGTNYYLWSGMNRISGAEVFKPVRPLLVAVLILCIGVWMTPHTLFGMEKILSNHHPTLGVLGLMSAKNSAVNIIILVTFFTFFLYRRATTGAAGEGVRGSRLQIAVLLVAGILVIAIGVVGYIPKYSGEIRINTLTPAQVIIVLFSMCLVTGFDVVRLKNRSAPAKIEWGNMTNRSQYILILIAVTFTSLMGLMGYARSGIRENWHVYGVVEDTSVDAFTPTLGYAMDYISQIMVVFVLLLVLIFWLRGLQRGDGDQ
ncbi:MAG: cytochrome ubiquinol oxidase subunit I [Nitrospinota bacterium]